ncbi:uncharacterized protein LOC113203279 [Frankliniella occidentalis]|uniref:Uncharacterized protein LOC113203279 n=1 Tax=Frankliniella occidentalis TaxID=133901 RepID=A0A9C6XAJ8_FRAOC|nr:uncharacterized protein LOC113203279 [Frankliniella occidentalis]
MKSFICVALCLLALVQVSLGHNSEEIKECADQYHIKKGDLKEFFEGDQKDVTHDDKCFMKCVLKHSEVLKDDGTIDASAMKDDEPDLVPYAEECSKIEKNDDLCELAYQHTLCMLEKVPKDKLDQLIKEHEEHL